MCRDHLSARAIRMAGAISLLSKAQIQKKAAEDEEACVQTHTSAYHNPAGGSMRPSQLAMRARGRRYGQEESRCLV